MSVDRRGNMRGAALLLLLATIIAVLAIMARPEDRYVERHEEVSTPIADTVPQVVEFSMFDPNTADYRTLLAAGVDRNVAVSIIRWREAGKVYRIKEDVALCYGVTDSLYFLLEPYIYIGEEFRYERRRYEHSDSNHTDLSDTVVPELSIEPFMLDTMTVEHLANVGFSERQAEVIIRYRDIIGGYTSIEEFARCYVVDERMVERLRPYIVFASRDSVVVDTMPTEKLLIEINSADSVQLCSVYGIGPRSAQDIIIYRRLLGGYYSVNQISELDVVTDENFQRILPQIWCDSAKIKKIYINFAGPNELEVHPYLSNRMLRRIFNHRELKGGWTTLEEMIEDNIFSLEEAERIAPYLDFGTQP